MSDSVPRTDPVPTLGEYLRVAREAKGWTQAQLCHAMWPESPCPEESTAKYVVNQWETPAPGQFRNFGTSHPEMIPRLARALDVPEDEVLSLAGQVPPDKAWRWLQVVKAAQRRRDARRAQGAAKQRAIEGVHDAWPAVWKWNREVTDAEAAEDDALDALEEKP